jgi:hypothetical protein
MRRRAPFWPGWKRQGGDENLRSIEFTIYKFMLHEIYLVNSPFCEEGRNMTTVVVLPVTGHHALRMLWQHEPDRIDVREAFGHLSRFLDDAAVPLRIIVDITADPRFPLAETISGALWGPFRSKMLLEWLVVGSSNMAHGIGRTLSAVTNRQNIRWFSTMDEVMSYLAEAELSSHERTTSP